MNMKKATLDLSMRSSDDGIEWSVYDSGQLIMCSVSSGQMELVQLVQDIIVMAAQLDIEVHGIRMEWEGRAKGDGIPLMH
jgi:ABC-type taurine transport system substrate-binding protein